MLRRHNKKKQAGLDASHASRPEASTPRGVRYLPGALLVPMVIALCYGLGLFDQFFSDDEPVGGHTLMALDEDTHSQRTIELAGFGSDGISLPYEATVVGSQRCAECHSEHVGLAKTNNMARSGMSIAPDDPHSWFTDERLDAPVKLPRSAANRFGRYERTDNGVFLTVPKASGRKLERIRVDAIFGSLLHAVGPVTFENGRSLRELPLSFSAISKSWFLTPGHSIVGDGRGALMHGQAALDCIRCHSSVLAWNEGRLDPRGSVFGISCERCHGPGSAHIELFQREDMPDIADAVDTLKANDAHNHLRIYNPGSFNNYDQTQFCSQCHRTPADLTPQQILTNSEEASRHAGAAMMLSACFRDSTPENTISCLDCHDPHRNANGAQDNFNTTCLRCHSAPASDHISLAITGTSNCVECHMEKVKNVMAGITFTSHWIRNPQPKPLIADRKQPDLQTYLVFLEGVYRERLTSRRQSMRQLSATGVSLAEVLYLRGERRQAFAEYALAINRYPENPEAFSSRARVHADLGRLDKAVADCDRAITLQKHNASHYLQRAQLRMRQGEIDGARIDLLHAKQLQGGDPKYMAEIDRLLEQIMGGRPHAGPTTK